MKAVLSACALLVGISALGQTISYFNSGFLRQPDAASDRRYLGVANLCAGTNILLTPAGKVCDYNINVTPGTIPGVASAKGVTPLVNGSVTITTPLANKTNVIHVTYVTDHLKTAYVMVSDIVDGVSFKIQGSTSGDTNLVCWSVFNP